MPRTFGYDILNEIKTRWSSRAYKNSPVTHDAVMALFEAARYAPSCFNEQPWRFILAETESDRVRIGSVLTEQNKLWALRAPVLAAVIVKKTFTLDGKVNYWSQFDAGAAWGYLSLEAEKRGLAVHAMGGFDRDAAADVLAVLPDYCVMAVIAIGVRGTRDSLPESLREREQPGTRKELDEIVFVGTFKPE